MLKIVIDPACGGKYVGHQSFQQYAKIVEKDYVLDLSMLQRNLFSQADLNVCLTREDDRDTNLEKRLEKTNGADILLSNHLNGGRKRGIEIRYSNHDDSERFAQNLTNAFENKGFLVRSCRTLSSSSDRKKDYDPLLAGSQAKCSVIIFYGYVDGVDYHTLSVSQTEYSQAILHAINETYRRV